MKFDTLVVSNDLVSKVQHQVKDNKFTWLSDIPEICNILEEFHLEGREDFEDLMRIFDSIDNQVVMPGVTFVCSEAFINQISEHFEGKSKEIAE